MSASLPTPFDVLVVTARKESDARIYQQELLRWQGEQRLSSKTVVLAACASEEAGNSGSGGQLLDALLCAAECIQSADLSPSEASVLVLPVDDCDHQSLGSFGFYPAPVSGAAVRLDDALFCIDTMLSTIAGLFGDAAPPRGVIVCKGGMTIVDPGSLQLLAASGFEQRQTTVIGTPSPPGASSPYHMQNTDGGATAGNPARVQGTSASNTTAFSPFAAHLAPPLVAKLLDASASVLQASTFHGRDNGKEHLCWDLWGLLLPAFARGELSGDALTSMLGPSSEAAVQTLTALAKDNGGLWAVLLPDTKVVFTRTHAEYLAAAVDAHSAGEQSAAGVAINSELSGSVSIGAGSAVVSCVMQGGVSVGKGSVVFGLRASRHVEVGPGCVVAQQRLRVDGTDKVAVVVLSPADDVTLPHTHPDATWCGHPLARILDLVPAEQLWGGPGSSSAPAERTLATARLFPSRHFGQHVTWVTAAALSASTPGFAAWLAAPRVSLDALASSAACAARCLSSSLALRRSAVARSAAGLLSSHSDASLLPLFRSARSSRPVCSSLYASLLRLAAAAPPDISSRALASLADLLAVVGGEGRPRSGPSRNPRWARAFALLREGRQEEGVREMDCVMGEWVWGARGGGARAFRRGLEEREGGALCDGGGVERGGAAATEEAAAAAEEEEEEEAWGRRPEMLLRTVRHLEAASRLMTSAALKTAASYVTFSEGTPSPLREWVSVAAPARIDLAGGWLDTPPVCYEAGGVVINAAVLVDGKRPIGARVRRIAEAKLILSVEGGPSVTCGRLEEIQDFDNPAAPAALLKAAFLALSLLAVDKSAAPLEAQLERFGGGFEVETWSELPQGSGMGTSSILGGAVISALGRAAGLELTPEAVVHAVLTMEQLMTTGGGWQDQCGGIYPGIKACSCPKGLPLHVTTDTLPLDAPALQLLSSHMVLIYTGKARLAATLLHDVLRRWHGRVADVVENIEKLRATAEGMRAALLSQDVAAVGRGGDAVLEGGSHLSDYWAQKKVMAPDAEPREVSRIMEAVKGLCHGMSLAGAGGGGFMTLITTKPGAAEDVEAVIKNLGVAATVHRVTIETEPILQ